MKKKTSIHDIARQLKVSATTVSFVLNGKATEKRISSDMEKKILKYVERVGFQRNHIAQSLRTGKSKIIGMLVEDISDPFFSSIARIVEENAYKMGYKIFNSSTENDTQKTKALLKVFRERQVDGYIIAPSPGIEEDIQSLIDDNLPVILFDRYLPGLHSHNVIVDNAGGAYSAIEHLLQGGYKNIGMVTLDSEQVQMADRLKGYMKAINENKLKSYVLQVPYTLQRDKIWEKVTGFINRHKKIDALLFATNYLAIGGLEAIHKLQLKIPDDIGIVGFDDNTHFSLFSPSITAVAQPVEEMSKTVIDRLINYMAEENGERSKETIILPTTLMIRQSSARNLSSAKKTFSKNGKPAKI